MLKSELVIQGIEEYKKGVILTFIITFLFRGAICKNLISCFDNPWLVCFSYFLLSYNLGSILNNNSNMYFNKFGQALRMCLRNETYHNFIQLQFSLLFIAPFQIIRYINTKITFKSIKNNNNFIKSIVFL